MAYGEQGRGRRRERGAWRQPGRVGEAIERQIPVTPIPVIAAALLHDAEAGSDELALRAGFYRRVEQARRDGRLVAGPSRKLERTFETALEMLQMRHLVREEGGVFRPEPGAVEVLRYYANSVER